MRAMVDSLNLGATEDTGHTPATPQDTGTQATEQTAASVREALKRRGFDIPEELGSDDAVLDEVAAMIDAANKVREDDTFREFQTARNEFNEWKRSRMSGGQQPSGGGPKPEPTSTENKPTVKGLSQEARLLQQHGLVQKQSDGTWAASNPQFQSAADEINQFEARSRNASLKLITEIANYDDPKEWIAEVVKSVLQTNQPVPTKDIEELQALKAEIEAQKAEKRQAEVQKWVNDNASRLFVNGDMKAGLTQFGQVYQSYEQQAPPEIQSDPLARHQWVMKFMAPIESLFSLPHPTASTPEPPPKPSLLGSAAARTNGPMNRLSNFQGAAREASSPQPILGKGKMPSLAGIVQQVNGTSH